MIASWTSNSMTWMPYAAALGRVERCGWIGWRCTTEELRSRFYAGKIRLRSRMRAMESVEGISDCAQVNPD
jgi:hypothetical protein